VNHTLMTTSRPFAQVIADNVAAARARLRLRQADLAARMTVQGWRWVSQTVSEMEQGRRAVRADELLGLALALNTTIGTLTAPPPDADSVALPVGQDIPAQRLAIADDSVEWDRNELRISPAAAARAEAAYLRELVQAPLPGYDELRARIAALERLIGKDEAE
jgi:transcriptional regulator with XRE-family HTH domain